MNLVIILIALAAFCGGILSALLGWLDSAEPFNGRKFSKSVLFALFAGFFFAVGYSFTDSIGVKDILLAVLAGAGVDGLSNRIIGAISEKKSTTP